MKCVGYEIGGFQFGQKRKRGGVTEFMCMKCTVVTNSFSRQKKSGPSVGRILMNDRTGLLYGTPLEPSLTIHCCCEAKPDDIVSKDSMEPDDKENSSDACQSGASDLITVMETQPVLTCSKAEGIVYGETILVPDEVVKKFPRKFKQPIIKEYQPFITSRMKRIGYKINGFEFGFQHTGALVDMYMCMKCCAIRNRLNYRKQQGISFGSISMEKKTGLLFGDPLKPSSLPHYCMEYAANEVVRTETVVVPDGLINQFSVNFNQPIIKNYEKCTIETKLGFIVEGFTFQKMRGRPNSTTYSCRACCHIKNVSGQEIPIGKISFDRATGLLHGYPMTPSGISHCCVSSEDMRMTSPCSMTADGDASFETTTTVSDVIASKNQYRFRDPILQHYTILSENHIKYDNYVFTVCSRTQDSILYKCLQCQNVGADENVLNVGTIAFDLKTKLFHGLCNYPSFKSHICSVSSALPILNEIESDIQYGAAKIVDVPKNVVIDLEHFLQKPVFCQYHILDEANIRSCGYHFTRKNSNCNSGKADIYICVACRNISYEIYQRKQKNILCGEILLHRETGLILGDPQQPSMKPHVCTVPSNLQISTCDSVQLQPNVITHMCNLQDETAYDEMISIHEYIIILMKDKFRNPIISNYRKLGTRNIVIDGFPFSFVRINEDNYRFECSNCRRAVEYAKMKGVKTNQIGYISLNRSTGLFLGDPLCPASKAHLCMVSNNISNTTNTITNKSSDALTGSKLKSIKIETDWNVFLSDENVSTMSAKEFENELNSSITVYQQLRDFRNIIKDAYAGDPESSSCVYVLFTCKHGNVREMMNSVFYIGKSTRQRMRRRLLGHKRDPKGAVYQVATKQPVWMAPLPIGMLSADAAADCEALFQFCSDINVLDVDKKNVINRQIIEIQNPVLSKMVMSIQDKNLLSVPLNQALHAAMRMPTEMICSDDIRLKNIISPQSKLRKNINKQLLRQRKRY